VTSNGERRQGTLSHNSVLRYLSTAFDNENYFFLGSIVDRILKKFTMSSTSSDSEMGFDSEDSEINFIRPWIRDSSRTGRVVRMSAEFITNFDTLDPRALVFYHVTDGDRALGNSTHA